MGGLIHPLKSKWQTWDTGYGLFLVKEILSRTHILIKENEKMGNGVIFELTILSGFYRNTVTEREKTLCKINTGLIIT